MTATLRARKPSADANRVLPADRGVHEWYRFVLSYPPHLVRDCLERMEVTPSECVLDPFCGTGTTVVECKKLGIRSVGIEANPMAHFASRVKLDWSLPPRRLLDAAQQLADEAEELYRAQGLPAEAATPFAPSLRRHGGLQTLSEEQYSLLLANSISPLPLHRTLVLRDLIQGHGQDPARDHLRLALAKAVVFSVSNLHFGPEVGVTTPKADAPLIAAWLDEVRQMAADLESLRGKRSVPAVVHNGDARQVRTLLRKRSVDAVVTSPPYPNEKDYTRTTRLESVLLGFLPDRAALRQLKEGLLRSNTRNVYKGDDDDQWIAQHPEIQRIAEAIETRRLELGKTSGFERLYHRVTKLYFGGMTRHLSELRPVLRPGARLAYVVGDQASYLRVMIRTGELLADVAQSLGYELLGIDLFRTRLATATREQLREEVVRLRWPG